MLKKKLVNAIVNDFGYSDEIIISKFEDVQKNSLVFQIQEYILKRYDYTDVEYLKEKITETIECFESNQLYAFVYVDNITFVLDSEFFIHLSEKRKTSENTKCLNDGINLSNYLKINYTDRSDKIIEEFYNNTYFKNKLSRLYNAYVVFLDSIATNCAKMEQVVLNPRELILVKTYGMMACDRIIINRYRNLVSDTYSIFTNTEPKNQEILNNSFAAIINTLKQYPNTDSAIKDIEDRQYIYSNLFTNPKIFAQLKNANHHMRFLYKCNSIYTEYDTIIFQEFTEGLISGYLQEIEIDKNKPTIRKLSAKMEALTEYNEKNENAENIQKINDRILFLKTKKSHCKFIPYKELSNRLIIDEKAICSYMNMNQILNITHINTIKKVFSTIKTIPIEIELSQF